MSRGVSIVAEGVSDAAIAVELERRRVLLAQDGAAIGPETVAMLCWTLGGQTFAMPLRDIYRVVPRAAVTIVPGAPPAMLGIFGQRGVVNSLFDPAAALDVHHAGNRGVDDCGGAMILLRQQGPRIAIRVDAVDEVTAVPVSADDNGADMPMQIVVLDDGRTIRCVDTAHLIGHLVPGSSPFLQNG